MLLSRAQTPPAARTCAQVCEWSCSSCFVYALCGRTDDAPPLPTPPDAGRYAELVTKLKKLGKHLARTQTISQVP